MKSIWKSVKGSRKLQVFWILFMASIGYAFYDGTSFSDLTEFWMWIFGIYAGGNVGEHGMKAFGTKTTNETQPEDV